MPHDRRGQLIERGDFVRVKTYQGYRVAEVASVTPEASHCNVAACYMVPGLTLNGSFNAGDCDLVMKADGTLVEAPA